MLFIFLLETTNGNSSKKDIQQSNVKGQPSQDHARRGAVIGRDADAVAACEHLTELGAETVMQPRVQEGVAAGWAHGAQVAEQLDEQEVALVYQVDVDVPQHVEHTDGHPAEAERRHHQAHQPEGLALAHPLRLRLTLSPVAGDDAVAQLDGDAQVRDAEGWQREHVGDEEGAVGVHQPLPLFAHPELFADDEALVLELYMVCVGHSRRHQPAGQQPHATEEVCARHDRQALFQGMHCSVVPSKTKRKGGHVLHISDLNGFPIKIWNSCFAFVWQNNNSSGISQMAAIQVITLTDCSLTDLLVTLDLGRW